MNGFGPTPGLQRNWDWRAAANFMAGGLGSGLILWSAAGTGGARAAGMAVGVLCVSLGLLAVWAEIGRPKRALNVMLHPRRSWMTREALVAPLLLAAALGVALDVAGALPAALAVPAALAFAYCQARIVQAAKGIPAWREPTVVPLLVATALAEGGGAWLIVLSFSAAAPAWTWGAFAAMLVLRLVLWSVWRGRVRTAPAALAAIDRAGRHQQAASFAALAAALIALALPLSDGGLRALQLAAGVLASAGGLWFKYTLITRGAFTQGFTLPHLPVRGVARRHGE